jgi:chemotaxis protein methyltransferase CheR
MNEAAAQAACFRHVVFPDSIGGYGRALNAAPQKLIEVEVRSPSPPPEFPPALSPAAESFIRWLFIRAGLRFSHYKPETLARRLPACLRAVHAASPTEARRLLRRRPDLLEPALEALLIGVTSFFRDEGVFSTLRRRVLPELVQRWRSRGADQRLRVWSAGCSSGAELYSVALLLLEQGALWPERCELLGTDCRGDAITGAAAGVFDPADLKRVPRELFREFFVYEDDHYRVRADVRSAVRWRRGDALAAPEPGPWDLVLCRNLAIYLQPAAATRLWGMLAAALRPGGVLVVGKAERPVGVAGLAPAGPCVYRRVDSTRGAGR